MFNSRTLFVLGAGASKEAGLPIGSELARSIVERLGFRFEHFKQKSGDQEIYTALTDHCTKLQERQKINEYVKAARRICDGLSLSNSIDDFIDAHRGDGQVELCGKLAIARLILEAERKSTLFSDLNAPERDTRKFESLGNTWFVKFFKILRESVSKSNVEQLFERVSFINFNYDRCLEFFLLHAVSAAYALDLETAQDVISRLRISHPYGTVGSLPAKNESDVVPFGGFEHYGRRLVEIAKGIRTFTEQVHDPDVLNSIRQQVLEADAIVFLGFAFHRQNMKLIAPAEVAPTSRVYASAYGISKPDCEAVESQIQTALGHKVRNVYVRDGVECFRLFDEYSRHFSLG